ncbi:MAG: DUF559 domain-containing protein [Saprospiraceae bacterium]|nr:DUF559 domain-containing protein [Saprospiraceae bacterium]
MKASPQNFFHYNSRLRNFAHSNRGHMTKGEACLWKYVLRGRMMKGYQFRRQRPVLNYIADFMCKELLLIIEVDGFTHQFEEVLDKDLVREQALQKAGFRILRFSDQEVLTELRQVVRTLEIMIEQIELEDAFNQGGDKH